MWYIDLIIWLAPPASWSAPRAPPCEHLPGDPDRRYRRASASLEHHTEYQRVKPVPTLERTQLVEMQDYAAFLGLLHLGFTCFQCFHASPIIVLPAIHFWRAASLFPPRLLCSHTEIRARRAQLLRVRQFGHLRPQQFHHIDVLLLQPLRNVLELQQPL